MPANGGAHLPTPTVQDHHPEQAHRRLQKAAIQRSAEGAGQVQRVLARHPRTCKTTEKLLLLTWQPRYDWPRLRRYDTALPRVSRIAIGATLN
jgi:hypothetical protein